MAGVVQAAGTGKWLLLALYAAIFVQVLFGLAVAGVESFQEGSFRPMAEYVGQTVFGADEKLYHDVQILTADDDYAAQVGLIVSDDPLLQQRISDMYAESLRNDIVRSLFILGLMVFLMGKFWYWVFSSQQNKVLLFVEAAGLAVLSVALFEFAYVAFAGEGLVWPFRGLWSLLQNIGNIWVIPSSTEIATGIANGSVTR